MYTARLTSRDRSLRNSTIFFAWRSFECELRSNRSEHVGLFHFTSVTCSRASLYVPQFFATTFSVG